jgi:hypothetical protein
MGEARRQRLWGWPVLVGGTLLGVVSLLADVVGIGGFAGFGWKQGLGVVLAFVLVLLGAYGVLGRERSP